MGQITCLGRMKRAQGPTASHRTSIDQHVRRIGSTGSQLDRGLTEAWSCSHLQIHELVAITIYHGGTGNDAVLWLPRAYAPDRVTTPASSLVMPRKFCVEVLTSIAECCACLQQLSASWVKRNSKKGRPDIEAAQFCYEVANPISYFLAVLWLNAVCDTACACDKVSNRKLRGAVHVQTTHVTGYGRALETREGGIFQMDAVPAIASDCHTILKHRCGASAHGHAITDAPTDGNALKSQVGLDGQNAPPLLRKLELVAVK